MRLEADAETVPHIDNADDVAQVTAFFLAEVFSQSFIGDVAYEALAEHFSEKERSDLSYVIGVINMWNRFSVGFQTHPE